MICVHMRVHVCMCMHVHMHRSEDNLQESGLLFHCVGSGDRNEVVRLGSKRLSP